MRAVVYQGPGRMAVEDVEEPRVEQPGDAVVRVTSTGICGSDLHMYHGRTAVEPGTVVGHEIMGVVERTGPGVVTLQEGDRVVLPFNIACGVCHMCAHGLPNACLVANPEGAGAAYGYVGLGPYRGGQAEQVRVPFADYNCLVLPGQPGDQHEDDFLLLSDVFPTGYHAAVLAGVKEGSTVAIFGGGPIGLAAVTSCLLRGAAQVFVVDGVDERLAKAEELGAIPIDHREGDPVEAIRAKRAEDPVVATMRGGDKLHGVSNAIDAVGYEADDWDGNGDGGAQRPERVLVDCIRVLNPAGGLGVIGVYLDEDPGAQGPAKEGRLTLPIGELWTKGIAVGTGQTPVKRYQGLLRDLIVAGKAKPSAMVSEHASLEEAPEAYQRFSERRTTKVVLRPER
jgi:glutathione-independent formaldehyde dehydrogenase